MPAKSLLGLIFCNVVWAGNPAMFKVLLGHFEPLQLIWLRYSSALVVFYLCLPIFKRKLKPGSFPSQVFFLPPRTIDSIWILVLGIAGFVLSPMSQAIGLHSAYASENSIFIAMEPLITALLAGVFLKEKMSGILVFSFALALSGFSLVSGLLDFFVNVISPSIPRNVQSESHLVGNLFILLSLLADSSYSILGRSLTQKYPGISIFGTSLAVAVLITTLMLLPVFPYLPFHLSQLRFQNVLALAWIGPLSTAGAYLFYLLTLADVPVMSTVLLLFLQPLFGIILGFLFLGERLTSMQGLGALFILLGIVIPNLLSIKQSKKKRKWT